MAIADKRSDIKYFVEVLVELHKIKVIQRAWRARRIERESAAKTIQHAYLAHTFKPGSGSAYKRALTSFMTFL